MPSLTRRSLLATAAALPVALALPGTLFADQVVMTATREIWERHWAYSRCLALVQRDSAVYGTAAWRYDDHGLPHHVKITDVGINFPEGDGTKHVMHGNPHDCAEWFKNITQGFERTNNASS